MLTPHATESRGMRSDDGEREPGPLRLPLLKKRSHLSEDVRRDSGMASSISANSDRLENTENASTAASRLEDDTLRPSSAVPTIIVVRDEPRYSLPSTKTDKILDARNDVSPGNDKEQSHPSTGNESFKAITTNIPTGTIEDPFSSQMQFSNRGSILFAPNDASIVAGSLQNSIGVRSTLGKSLTQQSGASYVEGQRIISAEERRLSRRVRSYYEPERSSITEPTSPQDPLLVSDVDKSEVTDKVPELIDHQPLPAAPPDDRLRESRSASALSMRSALRKEPNEAAGGIEDWTDVDSRDVDRWGFIKPPSVSSKRSSIVSASAPLGSPDPKRERRTGTMLSVVDEKFPEAHQGLTQRKKNRMSLNPGGKALRSSPSMLSSGSKRSAASRVVSLRRSNGGPRWLIDAPDMLLPPLDLGNEASDPQLDPAREARRADKWQKMARPISNPTSSLGAGARFSFTTSDPKLISRVWKGIPDRWRSEAWHAFVTSSAARRSPSKRPEPTDEALEAFFHTCQEDDCADDVQIDMDVPRTIGNHLQFRKRYRGGQRFLFRVLRALSLYSPDTGYVQGMASIVATLLVYYEESRAFVMAVRLWQLRGIKKLYTEGFEGLLAALQELEGQWIQHTEVLKQLETLGISTSAWGPKWYLTLFNYVVPFHSMLRIWDVFMLLGDPPATRTAVTNGDESQNANFDVLHAAAAAMLHGLRDMIVDADFENAMKALTSPVRVGKDDKMMEIAQRIWEGKRGKR